MSSSEPFPRRIQLCGMFNLEAIVFFRFDAEGSGYRLNDKPDASFIINFFILEGIGKGLSLASSLILQLGETA